jgi:hypothetical protein
VQWIEEGEKPTKYFCGLESKKFTSKGKGAFILGCTSPFKAIMIDRPGMGKVKN